MKYAGIDSTKVQQHLTECPGCDECDYLMRFYIACDCCGSWGHVTVEYYPQLDGSTLCQHCYDTEDLTKYE